MNIKSEVIWDNKNGVNHIVITDSLAVILISSDGIRGAYYIGQVLYKTTKDGKIKSGSKEINLGNNSYISPVYDNKTYSVLLPYVLLKNFQSITMHIHKKSGLYRLKTKGLVKTFFTKDGDIIPNEMAPLSEVNVPFIHFELIK